MKLATLRDASRDGKLVVVSRDNRSYVDATSVARCLQQALDDWSSAAPKLQRLSDDLNAGRAAGAQAFDPTKAHAPLPRAFEWIDGSAYINHIVLVRKARGAEPPATLRTDPLVYQGGSGHFLAPTEDIRLADPAWGCDFESEVCVVLGDTPQGTKKADAARYVRLVMLCNDVSLRNLIPAELEKGFGFFQSKPASAFSPICVTPDELGDAWRDGRVHLPLITHLNGKKFGDPDAGPEMHFSFFDLIEHLCKTRSYTAGTILGSGTISNEGGHRGFSCLAEVRMIEKIETGSMKTPFLNYGDTVEIEMFDPHGKSIFGGIRQKVVPL
jgi:fumarylacetoacetate (FAA) hydrolase